jgi:hypothetical protein
VTQPAVPLLAEGSSVRRARRVPAQVWAQGRGQARGGTRCSRKSTAALARRRPGKRALLPRFAGLRAAVHSETGSLSTSCQRTRRRTGTQFAGPTGGGAATGEVRGCGRASKLRALFRCAALAAMPQPLAGVWSLSGWRRGVRPLQMHRRQTRAKWQGCRQAAWTATRQTGCIAASEFWPPLYFKARAPRARPRPPASRVDATMRLPRRRGAIPSATGTRCQIPPAALPAAAARFSAAKLRRRGTTLADPSSRVMRGAMAAMAATAA